MKKYVIYLLLMMFSSMGAQAQKSYFKEALEKLVSNKAFTMNQSGAKNEVVVSIYHIVKVSYRLNCNLFEKPC